MIRTALFAALVVLFAAPIFAQDAPAEGLKVGDKAPDLPPVENWLNTPWYSSLDDLKGEVVLIKSWGIN